MIDFSNLPAQDKIYYQEDGIVIYCGDCRDILPLFEDKSFDLVLTDPPYGIGKEDWDTNYPEWCEDLAFSVSETVCIMVGQWNIPQCIKQMGDRYSWMFAGYKPMAMTRGRMGINKWLSAIIGGKIKNRGCDAKKFNLYIDGENGNYHSCQKPLGFVRLLIEQLSEPHDIILDMFMGSGTTPRASLDLNRKCIGIEIEEKYCEIAKKRLSQSVMRLEL